MIMIAAIGIIPEKKYRSNNNDKLIYISGLYHAINNKITMYGGGV